MRSVRLLLPALGLLLAATACSSDSPGPGAGAVGGVAATVPAVAPKGPRPSRQPLAAREALARIVLPDGRTCERASDERRTFNGVPITFSCGDTAVLTGGPTFAGTVLTAQVATLRSGVPVSAAPTSFTLESVVVGGATCAATTDPVLTSAAIPVRFTCPDGDVLIDELTGAGDYVVLTKAHLAADGGIESEQVVAVTSLRGKG